MANLSTYGAMAFVMAFLNGCLQCDAPPLPGVNETRPAEGTRQAAESTPCERLRARLCPDGCGERVERALGDATAEKCRRWLQSAAIVGVVGRADDSNLPPSCRRLVQSACEIAPSLCGDIRSVLPLGGGTIRQGEHCERITSSPHLMAQLAQRLARIAFAAGLHRSEGGVDEP